MAASTRIHVKSKPNGLYSLVHKKVCWSLVSLNSSFSKNTMKSVSVIEMVEPSSVEPLNPNEDEQEKIVHFTRVFRPIYCFARICGFMPFSIRRTDSLNGQFVARVSPCDALWFAISMCFYLTMIVNIFCGKILLLHEINTQLSAIALGNYLLRLMILSYSIFALIIDVFNRYKLVSILNDFTVFDQEVSSIDFPTKNLGKSEYIVFFLVRRWSAWVISISTKHSIKRSFDVHALIALQS